MRSKSKIVHAGGYHPDRPETAYDPSLEGGPPDAVGRARALLARCNDCFDGDAEQRFVREAPTLLAELCDELESLRPHARWHEALVGVERVLFACTLGDVPKEDGDRAIVRGKALKGYGKALSYARYEATQRREGSGRLDQVARHAGIAVVDLSLVERGVIPPFDEETTRRICVAIGCDAGPVLEARVKCEEALRE